MFFTPTPKSTVSTRRCQESTGHLLSPEAAPGFQESGYSHTREIGGS